MSVAAGCEDSMGEDNKKQDELAAKREARRRRRIRNQILAYSTVIIFIIALAAGVVFTVNLLSKGSAGGNVNKPTQESSEVTDSQTEESSVASLDESQGSESPESSEPEETGPVELTYEQKLDQVVNAAIEVMPLEDKVAGLFVISPELLTGVTQVTRAGDITKSALAKYAVGGLLYNSKNIKNKTSFMEMLDNTVLYSKYPIFLAVEEEGGKTTQIANQNIGSKTDSAKTIGETGDSQKAYLTGITIGNYLSELGINMNLAPVADLANVENSLMSDRSFGADAEKVSKFVTSEIKAFRELGILPCVKHFPGMGSVTTDTSKGIAVSDRTEADFWANEFVLFQSLIDEKVPMIMVSNMAAPSLVGDNTPCTLSEKVVTGILRGELGYDGLVITDALNEKAIADYHSSAEAAILALRAGCDMILCPENFEEAYNGVLAAVQDGTISQERIDDALRRIYRIKFADRVEDTTQDANQ